MPHSSNIQRVHCMKHSIFIISLSLMLAACNTLSSTEKNASAETLYYQGLRHLADKQQANHNEKALQYFQAASEKGYAAADNALAVMYDEGISVKMNKKLALNYYEKAAESQESSAIYNLAAYYYENDPKNPKLQTYLQQAIRHGDSDALNLQARLQLKQGEYSKAYQTFSKAAAQNNPDALFYLYLMTLEGQGTHKNKTKALNYLKKSAELNQTNALFTLGAMYLKGDGVPKDPTKAFQLLDRAAQAGHTKAIVNLAIMYVKGDGIEQDTQKAARLFEIAANRGDQQALEVMKNLRNIN